MVLILLLYIFICIKLATSLTIKKNCMEGLEIICEEKIIKEFILSSINIKITCNDMKSIYYTTKVFEIGLNTLKMSKLVVKGENS